MSNPKTPEQLAEEYANNVGTFSTEKIRLCSAYLSGYRARDAEMKAEVVFNEEDMEQAIEMWGYQLEAEGLHKYVGMAPGFRKGAGYQFEKDRKALEAAQARIRELEEKMK